MFPLLSCLLLMCMTRQSVLTHLASFHRSSNVRLHSHGNLAGNGRLLLAQRVEDAPTGSPCSLAGVAN